MSLGIPYTRKEDHIYLDFPSSELPIAVESLKKLLPFLTRDLCRGCNDIIAARVLSLDKELSRHSQVEESVSGSSHSHQESDRSCDNCDTHSLGSWKDGANGWSEHDADCSVSEVVSVDPPSARPSWADMADELEERGGKEDEDDQHSRVTSAHAEVEGKVQKKPELPREQREYIRFMSVQRKKDFVFLERINGRIVNVVDGLELHTGVFSAAEQKRIVDFVFELQEKGRNKELRDRTFTAPQKWMRGKGRVTIQFGCCYNYATDKNGNPPGILHNELVDPLPKLFKVIIRRLVQWHVLPPTCVPDSCIVNIYEEGDCIPPHIDNHDFVRPFCTVSFLSECNILFGSTLKIVGPGEFAGSVAIPLPVGSVLVLNGNGADVAKHCVPAVPTKRISITFRKMDVSKHPLGFTPEPDLQNIQPLCYDSDDSERLTPLNSPLSAKWKPATRDVNSGNRSGFFGRGNSYSEPRQRDRYLEKGKRVFGRGSGYSEPRQLSIREGKGILGRGGSHSEPRRPIEREGSSETWREGNHSGRRNN